MAQAVEQIEAEALQLSAADRARLAERLIASLDAEAEIEQAWAEEIGRRIASLDSGKAEVIPASEVLAQARSLIK